MKDDASGRRLNIAIMIIAVMMAIYQMVSAEWLFENTLEFMNNHLGFALVLVFLYSMKAKRKLWPLFLALVVISVVVTGYVKANFEELQWRFGFPTNVDIVIDILLIILCLEAARERFGKIIPGLAIFFTAYTFLVPYLPPPFYHPTGEPARVLAMFTTSFSGGGIYGIPLGVSANYIFLFLLFGGLLRLSGATDFFMEVAKLAGRRLRGGPAQAAVVSSALTSTVTGAAMANVMITGSFTIPMMKKVGYTPEQAGAIEAVASTGGLITPPVMGSTAFLMAAFSGIPYVQIMAAAAIPALFYYWSAFTYAELHARKLDIPPMSTKIDWGIVVRRGPLFIVPLGVIIGLLVEGYSPMHAAAWAVISIITLFIVINAITRERPWRLLFKLLLDGTMEGTKIGAGIAVVCAVLGLMMGMMTMTGVGIMISKLVAAWSFGILFLGALITMVVCIFLGTVVVAPVAYGLTAILAAPVLYQWDLSPMQVHLFILYYASLSAITPPVAVAALASSALAGANYLKTATRSWLIAAGVFTFPFIIIWNQTLILNFPSPLSGALTLFALAIGLLALNMTVTGYSLVPIGWRQRILYFLCVIGFLGYTFNLNYTFLVLAIILFSLLIYWAWRRAKQ